MSIKISNIFSETTGTIQVRFYIEHLYLMGTKVYVIGPGHMTKMASLPIYGKKPFKNLPQNWKSDDLETWKNAKRDLSPTKII